MADINGTRETQAKDNARILSYQAGKDALHFGRRTDRLASRAVSPPRTSRDVRRREVEHQGHPRASPTLSLWSATEYE
jgi:hypothetical protein